MLSLDRVLGCERLASLAQLLFGQDELGGQMCGRRPRLADCAADDPTSDGSRQQRYCGRDQQTGPVTAVNGPDRRCRCPDFGAPPERQNRQRQGIAQVVSDRH